jgi:hypothetical protein
MEIDSVEGSHRYASLRSQDWEHLPILESEAKPNESRSDTELPAKRNCYCEVEFTPLMDKKEHCSKYCTKRDYNERTNLKKEGISRICKWCGGDVSGRPDKTLCSTKCRQNYNNYVARTEKRLRNLPSWERYKNVPTNNRRNSPNQQV